VNSQFTFYQINALSLARFAFDFEATKANANRINLIKDMDSDSESIEANIEIKLSRRFLYRIESDITKRYRYVAVFIKDLIRVCFFCIYIKKASFLASFYAFTMAKLPRNRKETNYVRFLILLVKIFAAQRKEIVGVRVRFQGRVNRWRRTKHINGAKGKIAYLSYDSRIDYGMAQAITRKGAQGIRI